MRGPYTAPVRDFCQFWMYQFPCVSVRVSYGTLAGPTRAPYGSRRIWKTLKIPLRGPHDARTGIARGTHGALQIIRTNHKCIAVSSRMGPVAWCDHENSTDVKSLYVHFTRPYGQEIVRVIKIVRGPWLDVTEALFWHGSILFPQQKNVFNIFSQILSSANLVIILYFNPMMAPWHGRAFHITGRLETVPVDSPFKWPVMHAHLSGFQLPNGTVL